MSFYKFERGDLLLNTLTARPEFNFFIYNKNRYLNNEHVISGTYSSSATNTPPGYVNLYELNVNRAADNLVRPWVYSSTSRYFSLSPLPIKEQVEAEAGTIISGSYPLSASIQYYYYSSSNTSTKLRLEAMRNTINHYRDLSPHFVYDGKIPSYNQPSWYSRNLNAQNVGIITIPAIIHGSGLKRGSVSLKFYVSGTLQAQLTDENKRGELIQKSGIIPANDKKTAGIVLYNEGVIILTGSWDLNSEHTEAYLGGSAVSPNWTYFGSTMSGSITTVSSSYALDFQATEKIPNITMMAHANRGELNFSNNPTFVSSSAPSTPLSSSLGYYEQSEREIKNIVSSSYVHGSGSFEKITYITKVGIYDKYKNLIAFANLATPVRKREQDSYTFKLKLDM